MEKISCNIQSKIAIIDNLPAPSPFLQKLLSIMPDNEGAPERLNEIIVTDPGVSAQVLRVANSAYFGFPGRISTISKAILLLGPREVWSISVGIAFKQQFSGIYVSPAFDLKAFWRHSYFTGIIEGMMAKEVTSGSVTSDEAMIMGLLHDLGRLVMASYFVEKYEQIDAYRRKHGLIPIEAERDKGLLHTYVGELLCQYWRFPEAIQEAVADHHYYELPNSSTPSFYGVLTGISNLLAKRLGEDGELDLDSEPLSQALEGYEWARLVVKEIKDREESIREYLDEILRLID